MTFLRLFYEFFKVGLFSVGGGMATLPFLYDLSEKTGWFTATQLADMVAVSESSPGPIGVNMATYVGFTVGDIHGGFFASILGAAVATLGLITPSIIIILIVAAFMKRFSENRIVKSVFYGIRPASVAMICAALLLLAKTVFLNLNTGAFFLNWQAAILFVICFALISLFKKLHPIAFIGLGAAAGIIFSL